MKNYGIASDYQETLAAHHAQDETVVGEHGQTESISSPTLLQVLAKDNLQRALKQVRRNKGAPG